MKTMQKKDNQQTKAGRKAFTTTPLAEQEGAGISLFHDMQEHPESYSDNELEAMMDSLDQQPDLEKAWREFESKFSADHPKSHPATFHHQIRKAAAILIGILILSGIAYAAIRLVRSHQPMVHPEQAEKPKDSLRSNLPEPQKPWTTEVNSFRTDRNKFENRKDEPRAMLRAAMSTQPVLELIIRLLSVMCSIGDTLPSLPNHFLTSFYVHFIIE